MTYTMTVWVAWRRLNPGGVWKKMGEFLSQSDAVKYVEFHCIKLKRASGVVLRAGEHPLLSEAKK